MVRDYQYQYLMTNTHTIVDRPTRLYCQPIPFYLLLLQTNTYIINILDLLIVLIIIIMVFFLLLKISIYEQDVPTVNAVDGFCTPKIFALDFAWNKQKYWFSHKTVGYFGLVRLD